jgi:hypothetical protein
MKSQRESKTFSSTLSSTPALFFVRVVKTTPPSFSPWERVPILIVQEGGWAPGQGPGGCGKSRPHKNSIPGTSIPWQVAKPTELSRVTTTTTSWKSLTEMITPELNETCVIRTTRLILSFESLKIIYYV